MHESGPMLNDIQGQIILLTNTMDAFIIFASYFLLLREFQQPYMEFIHLSVLSNLKNNVEGIKLK